MLFLSVVSVKWCFINQVIAITVAKVYDKPFSFCLAPKLAVLAADQITDDAGNPRTKDELNDGDHLVPPVLLVCEPYTVLPTVKHIGPTFGVSDVFRHKKNRPVP
jgi:hypothetical protein